MKKMVLITMVCVLIAAYVTAGLARDKERKRPDFDPCFDNRGKWYTMQ